jgi:hypothetical protein
VTRRSLTGALLGGEEDGAGCLSEFFASCSAQNYSKIYKILNKKDNLVIGMENANTKAYWHAMRIAGLTKY